MVLSFLACAALMSVQRPDFKSWGDETLASIRQRYEMPSGLYAEHYTPGQTQGQPAFDWSVGVFLSALNAGAKLDDKFKPELRRFADKTRAYWNETPPVAGYDVLPDAKDMDRFYDDNAWMVMALAETSAVLRDKKYLTWAEQALNYDLSGEDDKLGGGIYWHEKEKTSKNTCSNAPAAAACLAVYERTKNPALLTKAIELYAWCKDHLQDPADHLMWDNVSLSGKISKDKWSYNTALMIRTAARLFALTKKPEYRSEAWDMADSSRTHWIDAQTGALKDEGPFAHLLYESWIILDESAPRSKTEDVPVGPIVFLHEHARLGELYGKRWDRPPSAETKQYQLLDESSVARAYFETALFLKNKR